MTLLRFDQENYSRFCTLNYQKNVARLEGIWERVTQMIKEEDRQKNVKIMQLE